MRNLTAQKGNMMSEVCEYTEIEPKFTQSSRENLQGRTSNNSNDASVDIRTQGFRELGQQAFFDIKVFHPKACCYRNKSLQQCHVMNEQGRQRERILQIDHGTFTPLVSSISVFNQRLYRKSVPKLLLAFGTTDIWKERPAAVDFK